MEKELVYQVLGIRGLTDERSIKAAYMQKLKGTNPEDDPEGFRKLREAYEQALELLRRSEEEKEEQPKTEKDIWIAKVDKVYKNYKSRGNVEAWKALFEDEYCQSLDTSLEARDAMLGYLMSCFYLPREIWQSLDREFQIMEDYDNLKERYPEDFLEYIRHYVQYDYYVDFDKMRLRDDTLSEDDTNVDEYIRTYQDLRGLCDQEEWKQAEEKLSDIAAYGVWYPWEDAERVRVLEAKGELKQADALAQKLIADWPEDQYLLLRAANVKWTLGEKEEAFALWSRSPDNYDARIGIIKYYLENEETAEKAKDMALDIWEQDGSGQRVDEYIKRANELLLNQYGRKLTELEDGPEKDAVLLEIAWCKYQDREMEESIRILDDLEPADDIYYSYHNLKGRVLAALGKNKEAVPELRVWLSMILETVDDGSEESQKRLRRKGTAYLMLGFCLSKIEEYDEAVEMLKRAEEEITDLSEKYGAMNTLAETYLSMEEYERAVDKCDQIIAGESGYYPAYVNRQKAYFEMQKSQGVVDDYYRAVEIYPGYYMPYLLAAKVFFFCRQYEDAKGVLARAAENEVEFSDEMKLFQVKILRNLAQSEQEREEPMRILRELKKSVNPEETDLEDTSEIEYETALLYWDNGQLDTALKHLGTAIRQNPSRGQYFMVKGDLLRQKDQYKEALSAYQTAKEDYEGTAVYYYGVGCCHEGLEDSETALSYFMKAAEQDAGYRDVNEKISDIYMERYKTGYDPEDFSRAMIYIKHEVENWENCYILVHRGLMYMEVMQLEKAIEDFEKALTYQPDDWAAYNNMGYCYKHKGDYKKSIEMYEKSLEALRQRNDKRVLPYSNMADCYEILGEYERAVDCYEKDLEWYPDRISFYQEIGDMYYYMGDYQKAIKSYETAGSKWQNKEYLIKIGDALFAQGKLLRAKGNYKKAIQTADPRGDAYYRYNDYAERLITQYFDYKGAIAILQKANQGFLKGDWNASRNAHGTNERFQARAYYLSGNLKEAAAHAKKALELYLADAHSEEAYLEYPVSRPLHLSRVGECYLYMGQTEKAYELFGQMGSGYRCEHCRFGECYEKYRNLGLYYLGLGGKYKRDALEHYEKALSISMHDLELKEMVKKLRKETGK